MTARSDDEDSGKSVDSTSSTSVFDFDSFEHKVNFKDKLVREKSCQRLTAK